MKRTLFRKEILDSFLHLVFTMKKHANADKLQMYTAGSQIHFEFKRKLKTIARFKANARNMLDL